MSARPSFAFEMIFQLAKLATRPRNPAEMKASENVVPGLTTSWRFQPWKPGEGSLE